MAHLLAYALMFVAVLFEIPMAGMILDLGTASFPAALVFHMLSSAMCALGFYAISEKAVRGSGRGNIWWGYALTACLVMPLYGILSTILIYAVQAVMRRQPPPVVSDEIEVPDSEVFAKSLTRNKQIEVLERLDIEPFVDIFRSGQAGLKKSAVKFLSAIKSQAAMNTLNRALMDDDIEVRLYAAGVIGLIDDNFTREIDILSGRLAVKPDDATLGLALADMYLSYAQSGLLDRIAQAYYYKETVRVLSTQPASAAVNYRLARSWYELENFEAAKKAIERCIEEDGANAEYNRLLCDVLFARREYDVLLLAVERMRKERILPADDELMKFWG